MKAYCIFRIRYDSCHDTTNNSLQWRHNKLDGVWNQKPHDCLLNRLFGCRLKKTPKLRVNGRTNGHLRRKCFHLMTSSCAIAFLRRLCYYLIYHKATAPKSPYRIVEFRSISQILFRLFVPGIIMTVIILIQKLNLTPYSRLFTTVKGSPFPIVSFSCLEGALLFILIDDHKDAGKYLIPCGLKVI